MRTRNDWQIIEVVWRAVMKRLLILTALLALSASAETGWYKLILVTVTDHFEPQIGAYPTLRECTTEGARRLHDQDIYAGFGCVFWNGSEHEPKEGSKHAPEG
jgi:hypothetical protein